MPTTVGILTFMNGKNSILGLSEPKKTELLDIFYSYGHLKFHEKSFITSDLGCLHFLFSFVMLKSVKI